MVDRLCSLQLWKWWKASDKISSFC